MFQVAESTDTDLAGTIATSFYKNSDPSPEEKLRVIEYLADLPNPQVFASLVSNLPLEELSPPRALIARAKFLARNQRFSLAIKLAEQALDGAPLGENHIFLLELYLASHAPSVNASADEASLSKAGTLIRRMIDSGQDDLALAALKRVSAFPDPLIYFRERELLGWFETFDPEENLIRARFALERIVLGKMFAGEQKERLRAFMQKYKAQHPAEVAALLVEFGANDLLEDFDEAFASENSTVFYAKIESLLKQNKFAAAKELLANPPLRANKTIIETLLGAIAFAENDNQTNQYHIGRAFQSASFERSYSDFHTIMTISERFGDQLSARKAAEAIAAVTAASLPDVKNLGFLDVHLGRRPQQLLTTFQKLYADRPDDVLVGLKYAHLLIVTGTDLDRAEAVLTGLPEDETFAQSILSALALLDLAKKKPQDALARFEAANLDWTSLRAQSDKAVYTTALYLGRPQQSAEAITVAAEIDWNVVLDYFKVFLLPLWDRNAPAAMP